MSKQKDYYDVLGVGRDASADEIRSNYRKLARQYHTDVNKDPQAKEIFIEINEAYEVLSNGEKRATYDRFGHNASEGSTRDIGRKSQMTNTNDFFRGFGLFASGFDFFPNGKPFVQNQPKVQDYISIRENDIGLLCCLIEAWQTKGEATWRVRASRNDTRPWTKSPNIVDQTLYKVKRVRNPDGSYSVQIFTNYEIYRSKYEIGNSVYKEGSWRGDPKIDYKPGQCFDETQFTSWNMPVSGSYNPYSNTGQYLQALNWIGYKYSQKDADFSPHVAELMAFASSNRYRFNHREKSYSDPEKENLIDIPTKEFWQTVASYSDRYKRDGNPWRDEDTEGSPLQR